MDCSQALYTLLGTVILMAKTKVGVVIHFYPKISVAIIDLSADLKKGDRITIEGRGNSIPLVVESMQIEHDEIAVAKKGQAIGMRVPEQVKQDDEVFKIE